jgi:hypothetical protein
VVAGSAPALEGQQSPISRTAPHLKVVSVMIVRRQVHFGRISSRGERHRSTTKKATETRAQLRASLVVESLGIEGATATTLAAMRVPNQRPVPRMVTKLRFPFTAIA